MAFTDISRREQQDINRRQQAFQQNIVGNFQRGFSEGREDAIIRRKEQREDATRREREKNLENKERKKAEKEADELLVKNKRQQALDSIKLVESGASPKDVEEFNNATNKKDDVGANNAFTRITKSIGKVTETREKAKISKILISNAEKAKKQRELSLTPGQKVFDREAAKDLAAFSVGGGASTVAKDLTQLKEVEKNLLKSDLITGPVIGALPDFLRDRLLPESKSAQEAVEEVVQRNLKKVLGGQFTEREGEKLVKRAFNISLGEKENKKRLGRLIKQIELAAVSKQEALDYFQDNGTMAGFKGKIPTVADFESAIDGKTEKDFEFGFNQEAVAGDIDQQKQKRLEEIDAELKALE